MDGELSRMQAQAARFSDVRLSRGNAQCAEPSRSCKKRGGKERTDDGILLLGLILILASDGGDRMLLLMLLYIFSGGN